MKYVTGLIVGKFCPLHAGHVALIEHARKQCERIVILSYTSLNFPGCEAENRERWLKEMYPYPSFTIKVLDGLCPNDHAEEEVHRRFCADYLLNTLETTVDAVFTSEDYGDGFAEYLSRYFSEQLFIEKKVEHVLFDKARVKYAVSGTEHRSQISAGRIPRLLPYRVRADFVPRILLLGGESSGKTTLAQALALELHCPWVPEFGREFYDARDGDLRYEDMEFIAKTQIDKEHKFTVNADMLVCDTSPLTTLFYSMVMFNRASSSLQKMSERQYDKVYLCMPDINFEQDGTRRDDAFRLKGHQWYIDNLTRRNIPFKTVGGSVAERVKFIADDINKSL